MRCRKFKNRRKTLLGLGMVILAMTGLLPVDAARISRATPEAGSVTGNNQFAWELYRKITAVPENQGRNIFFSPYSLATVLTMTYAGSRGNTAKEMAQVLHVTQSPAALPKARSAWQKQLAAHDTKSYQLNCANALWAQQDYHLQADFIKLIKQYYSGGLQLVDFITQPQTALTTINQWVERQTASKIKNFLKRDDLDSLTRLVLTNAVYFKGIWQSRFRSDQSQTALFVTGAAPPVNVTLMRQKGQFRYAEADGVQLLELPYLGEKLSMLVMLPQEKPGPSWEAGLSAERIHNWRSQLAAKEVEVWLPRFKFETRYYLERLLPALGMNDAFSQTKADFSGITGKRDLFISHLIHQAVIEVNEEGSTAAAAGAVTLRLKGGKPAPVFRADHPFSFAIIQQATGAVLFLGRVADPTQL